MKRRVLNVLAAVDAAREVHPELRQPLTVGRLERALAREEIAILRRPIRARAYVEGALGSFVIVVQAGLNPRHARRVIGHEFAHIRLHHRDDDVVFQRSPCQPGDPREFEAQLFVRLLELGPEATPDHPAIARLVAALETRELLGRRPTQLNLEIPEPAPSFPSFNERLAAAYEDSLAYGEQKRRRRGLSPVEHAQASAKYRDDLERTGYDDAKRAAWFRDIADRRWWIFNFMRVAAAGGEQWERVLDSMSPRITYRLFVSAGGERRLYRFANGREARAHRAKHLDRQLAEATRLRRRASADVTQPRTARASRR